MLHHFDTPEDFILDHRFINYCFKNNDNDEAYWENWISEHPEKEALVREAKKLVHTLSVRIPSEEKQKEWEKINLNTFHPGKQNAASSHYPRSRKKFRLISVAAVLIILMGTWWFWENNKKIEDESILPSSGRFMATAFETNYGEQRTLVLADGTKVWLNADSKLTYVSDFKTDDKREVSLSGEAYFEVNQKPDQPFIVHTKEMHVIVLGTSFNVKAYPKDPIFEMTLINGSVNVQLKSDLSKKIRLKPKEKLTVYNHTKKTAVHQISDSLLTTASVPKFSVSEVYKDPHLDDKILETVWRQGKLAFQDERFGTLALAFNHRYGVTLHFENQEIKEYRYTGVFTKESLEDALKALQLTSPSHPFTYRIQDKDVFISKPETKK